jgi:hypothetical protein
MLADILRGSTEWLNSWRRNGGEELARSHGIDRFGSFRHFVLRLKAAPLDLLSWPLDTLPCARWRDGIFVHAGLPKRGTLETLLSDDSQLWDPDAWFIRSAGVSFERQFVAFRQSGFRRVMMGHYPQDRGPQLDHGGTLLLLATPAASSRLAACR